MYDTKMRHRIVREKASRMRRSADRLKTRLLGAWCLVLAAFTVGMTYVLSGTAQGGASGMMGSMLLFGRSGGYVLTGVAAFAAAALITVLCMRRRNRTDQSGTRRT